MSLATAAIGLLVAAAIGIAGCGPFATGTETSASPTAAAPGTSAGASTERSPRSPTIGSTDTTDSSALAVAGAAHEYPGRPVRETVTVAAGDPTDAVRAFAAAYVNWSAATVAADMHRLAARSIGEARSAMALAAAQTAADGELRRAGIANRGTVEAVIARHGTSGAYIVVTRETTTAAADAAYAGVGAAWHVTVATVTRLAGGRWVVSGWQPES